MNRFGAKRASGWLASLCSVVLVGLAIGAQKGYSDDAKPDRSVMAICDRDGSNVRILEDAMMPGNGWDSVPKWSPDGASIAYGSCPKRGDRAKMHIIIYHLSGPKQGTNEDLGVGSGPDWSPDGKRLAFMAFEEAAAGDPGVWTMNADGTERKWLCKHRTPTWLPDGKNIMCMTNDPQHQLMMCDAATGKARPFAQEKMSIYTGPAFSPDGKKVALVAGWDDARTVAIYDVEREEMDQMLWANKGTTSLPSGTSVGKVAWNPKRPELLVLFSLNEKNSMYLLGMGALQKINLQKELSGIGVPVWSPDGNQILFCFIPVE